MRYWRSHRRQSDVSGDRSGRHRRPKRSRQVEEPYAASAQPDGKIIRRWRRQPRDSRGRFLSFSGDRLSVVDARQDPGAADAEAADAAETAGGADAADRPETPDATAAAGRRGGSKGFSWSDFELSGDLPRTGPRAADSAGRPDGRRHCGELEDILHRQWDAADGDPPPDVVRAIESLAELPAALKERLASGLDGIYVGPGGVPELDDMNYLRGRPLPSGKAAWDICAGAYGDRKIVVGDQPSPTPDVMMHEVGHALDDIDGSIGAEDGEQPARQWQSDSPEFRAVYESCRHHLASDFHNQGQELGRREFFADAFAAIASRQRPALVDMLGGNTRAALDVMLYFNRRYGI